MVEVWTFFSNAISPLPTALMSIGLKLYMHYILCLRVKHSESQWGKSDSKSEQSRANSRFKYSFYVSDWSGAPNIAANWEGGEGGRVAYITYIPPVSTKEEKRVQFPSIHLRQNWFLRFGTAGDNIHPPQHYPSPKQWWWCPASPLPP